jgi:hypothetical protein
MKHFQCACQAALLVRWVIICRILHLVRLAQGGSRKISNLALLLLSFLICSGLHIACCLLLILNLCPAGAGVSAHPCLFTDIHVIGLHCYTVTCCSNKLVAEEPLRCSRLTEELLRCSRFIAELSQCSPFAHLSWHTHLCQCIELA